MQKQLDDIKKDITEIKYALIGTEFTGKKGALDAIHQNTIFRRRFVKYIGISSGIGMATGGFVGFCLSLLKGKLGV